MSEAVRTRNQKAESDSQDETSEKKIACEENSITKKRKRAKANELKN